MADQTDDINGYDQFNDEQQKLDNPTYNDEPQSSSLRPGHYFLAVLAGGSLLAVLIYVGYTYCTRWREIRAFDVMTNASREITSTFEMTENENDEYDESEEDERQEEKRRRTGGWMGTKTKTALRTPPSNKTPSGDKGVYMPPPSSEGVGVEDIVKNSCGDSV